MAAASNSTLAEIFSIEIEGWCYGIESYPGEIYPTLVFLVVKELEPVLHTAVQKEVVLDLVDVGTRIASAGKFVVSEHEVTAAMVGLLPSPHTVDESKQIVLAQMLDIVEAKYPGTIEILEKRWANERRKAA